MHADDGRHVWLRRLRPNPNPNPNPAAQQQTPNPNLVLWCGLLKSYF